MGNENLISKKELLERYHISCSGSIKGEGNVFCNGDFKCSGSTHLEKELRAKNITVSGALRVAENIFAENTVRVSGGMVCKGELKSTPMLRLVKYNEKQQESKNFRFLLFGF